MLNGNAIRWTAATSSSTASTSRMARRGPARLSTLPKAVGAIFLSKNAGHNIEELRDYPVADADSMCTGSTIWITHNYVHDLMNLPERGWWAVGIMICNSTIRCHSTASPHCWQKKLSNLGFDGGAIELDDRDLPKDNITIDHNTSYDNQGFRDR